MAGKRKFIIGQDDADEYDDPPQPPRDDYEEITAKLSLRMSGNRSRFVLKQFTDDVKSTGANIQQYRDFADSWPRQSDKFPTYREMFAALSAKSKQIDRKKVCDLGICDGNGIVIMVDKSGNEWAAACTCKNGDPYVQKKGFNSWQEMSWKGWKRAGWEEEQIADSKKSEEFVSNKRKLEILEEEMRKREAGGKSTRFHQMVWPEWNRLWRLEFGNLEELSNEN